MKQIWIRGFDGWPLITKTRTMVNFDGSPRLLEQFSVVYLSYSEIAMVLFHFTL